MKHAIKQTGIILGCSMLLCFQSCKEKTPSEETTATTETVETIETVEELSQKAKEKQIEKLNAEEAAIALAKKEAEEKAQLEAEAIEAEAALERERLARESQARRDSLALIEQARIDRQEQARLAAELAAAEKRRAEEAAAAAYANRPCKRKTFRGTSHHSWVEFRLPQGKKNKSIRIQGGAYNNYVFPKCNRVHWSDLVFECDDRSRVWKKVSGKWDADAACHGSKGNSPYVFVGKK